MNIVTIALTILFSVFSSFVMSYIALATMIGPWMGPTLVVIGLVLSSCCRAITPAALLPAVSAGALGGIIATCISFSFPTYYFIDKDFFIAWTQSPVSFISVVALLSIVAGLCAFVLVHFLKKTLLEEQNLPFPIGKLVYDIAFLSEQKDSKKQLLVGFLGTLLYAIVNGIAKLKINFYKGFLTLFKSFSVGPCIVPALKFDMDLIPMFVSIGFIAGHLMTIPLLLGACARITVVDILHSYWFSAMPESDFMLAFCSGIVVIGALISVIETPKKIWLFLVDSNKKRTGTFSLQSLFTWHSLIVLFLIHTLLFYFNFSFISQVYVLLFTALCTYQLVVIAGKTGMALLGRFATFIMVPGIFLFRFTGLQATVVATFVELCGGIATELLFGFKSGQLAQLNDKKIMKYQLLGLVVGSVAVAVAFWFLVTHFQLGSDQLFAQRAQGRALLIQAGTFDYKVLLLGALFGLVLHAAHINAMLVLGGLLMSLSMIIPLVIGGALAFYVQRKERFEPLCAGIYATNSLCMIFSALFGR